MALNSAKTIVAGLALTIALASCGKSSDQTDAGTKAQPERRLPLAAEEKRLEERRAVTAGDLRRVPTGSVQRAFYEYWSAMENEEWSVALDYFPPATRRRLKPGLLVVALRIETQTPLVKPLIRSVRRTGPNQASVRYYVRRTNGSLRPTSMTWRRSGGRWYIAYCSTLDDSYSSAVQEEVQTTIDPKAKTPSKEALRAAAEARRAQAALLP
ncbi:MAG TPA: hypothetical protein VF526_02375 [Solirubrobacteraceae bacterium]